MKLNHIVLALLIIFITFQKNGAQEQITRRPICQLVTQLSGQAAECLHIVAGNKNDFRNVMQNEVGILFEQEKIKVPFANPTANDQELRDLIASCAKATLEYAESMWGESNNICVDLDSVTNQFENKNKARWCCQRVIWEYLNLRNSYVKKIFLFSRNPHSFRGCFIYNLYFLAGWSANDDFDNLEEAKLFLLIELTNNYFQNRTKENKLLLKKELRLVVNPNYGEWKRDTCCRTGCVTNAAVMIIISYFMIFQFFGCHS